MIDGLLWRRSSHSQIWDTKCSCPSLMSFPKNFPFLNYLILITGRKLLLNRWLRMMEEGEKILTVLILWRGMNISVCYSRRDVSELCHNLPLCHIYLLVSQKSTSFWPCCLPIENKAAGCTDGNSNSNSISAEGDLAYNHQYRQPFTKSMHTVGSLHCSPSVQQGTGGWPPSAEYTTKTYSY